MRALSSVVLRRSVLSDDLFTWFAFRSHSIPLVTSNFQEPSADSSLVVSKRGHKA